MKDKEIIEKILIDGLSKLLKRTSKLNFEDQLAIAQEYKEWISCIAYNDFSEQEILIIDRITFENFNSKYENGSN